MNSDSDSVKELRDALEVIYTTFSDLYYPGCECATCCALTRARNAMARYDREQETLRAKEEGVTHDE